MKFVKLIFSILYLLSTSENLSAQEDRFNSEFINNFFIRNPSMPNENDEIKTNLYFTSILNNKFPGVKRNVQFSFQYPILKELISGLDISNESAGHFQYQHLNINSAVAIKIGEKSILNYGFSIGYRSTQLNQLDKDGSVFNDPLINSNFKSMYSVYTGTGLTFYNNKLAIQVLYPNTINYFSKFDTIFDQKPFLLNAEYTFPLENYDNTNKNSVTLNIGYFKNSLIFSQQSENISIGAKYTTSYKYNFKLLYNTSGIFNTGFGVDVNDKFHLKINYLIGGIYSSILYGNSGLVLIGFNFKKNKYRR